MDLSSPMDLLTLKGYGLYVWPAYALCAAAIAVEMHLARQRLARALRPDSDTEPVTEAHP